VRQLLRGSRLLRNMGRFSTPNGLDAARVAELAHKALNTKNTKNSDAVGAWVQALMEIRTAARASLNLPPIPRKGTADGEEDRDRGGGDRGWAVLKALRADGWPTFGTVHALDKDGKAIEGFSGLRFIYETEEVVRQAPVAK
jgi:hypothetical protein